MKTILTLLAFISINASALEVTDLIGKYTVVSKNCDISATGNLKRAYITVDKPLVGNSQILTIQFYGDDAVVYEVLLGSGSTQMSGTSVQSHGLVTHSWNTKFSFSDLTSVENIVRPSTGYRQQVIKKLLVSNGYLTLSEITSESMGKATQTADCTLLKVK